MVALGILMLLALLLLAAAVLVVAVYVGARVGDVASAIDRQTAVLDDDDGPEGDTLPVPATEAPALVPLAARPRTLCGCAVCRAQMLTHAVVTTEPRAAHVSQGFGVVRAGWA